MTKKEPKIKIFVSHHKPGYIYEDDIFVPIQVGKKNAKVDLGILGDDTGYNISEKNSNYAELTAQYRVWKNYDLSDVDYVGFCHYRRYLSFHEKYKIKDIFSVKDKNCTGIQRLKYILACFIFYGHNSLIRDRSRDLLEKEGKSIKNKINKKINVYLPKKIPLKFGYPRKHLGIKNKELEKIVIDTFLDLYPQYKKALDKTRKMFFVHTCNIFIMDTKSFFQYSERLFTYLFELEKRIKGFDLSKEMLGDGRFIGVFSEALVDLWLNCVKPNKRIKEKNLIYFNIDK